MSILIRINDAERAAAFATILETIVSPGAEGDDAILIENVVAQLHGFVPPGDERRPIKTGRPDPLEGLPLAERFGAMSARGDAWRARLQEPLSEEDVSSCPSCGASGVHWLREIGKRHTWQPLSVRLDPEHGLIEDDYGSFDYGDDVEVDYFECGECENEWPSLERLHHAFVSAKHARDDADWLEQTLGDETMNALAVLVCHPAIRLQLEQNDPMALAQARKALGLPVHHEQQGEA